MDEMEIKELLKYTPAELVDKGVCPTCLNRLSGGAVYGNQADKSIYEDEDIEVFFVANPRAAGHACLLSRTHYQDFTQAPDALNEKIARFAKRLAIILKEVYSCERVYLCTMCDGPANHYHVQLIPRYPNEKRGSTNFVKPRTSYVYEPQKLNVVRQEMALYAKENA